jgi:nitroreductase
MTTGNKGNADLFHARRSIRRFLDKPIEQEVMAQLFEAARVAPSWANMQCWELVVVRDAEQKKKLSTTLSPKNPATLCVENAPVVIAVCGNPKKSGYYKDALVTRYSHWFMYDLGLISANICLKACELGLGTVMVGFFDHSSAEKILNVPEGIELVSLIPVGYPGHESSSPPRKDLDQFVHYDSF